MFKRVFWMGTGMAVGAGGAFWAKRKAEETIEHYLPDQVAERASASARELRQTVRAAATEGRDAMRHREEELRDQVEARTFVGPGPGRSSSVTPPVVVAPGARRRRPTPRSGPATPGSRRRARRRTRR
ncbi:hypothetical protein BH23ACT2_BH23ACT2_03950 [soil metagenome]